MRTSVRYRVAFPDLAGHRVRVTMEIDDAPEGGVRLFLPAWTPGSYLIREFARHVVALTARRVSGDPVPAEKVAKNEWLVTTKAGKRVDVEYELYANELTVRTNHVDPDHAFLQPAATFLVVRGREAERANVTIEAPEAWRVFTQMPLTGEDTYVAEDLDALMDAPIEAGPHPVLRFEVEGVPHRIAVFGEGNFEPARLTSDVHAACLAAKEIFPGPHPCRSYTFLFHIAEGARGGLEHFESSVCAFEPHSFRPERSYLRQLSLVAHEYFHLWNGKRIRPVELGPFDYERECPTRHLWVAEGVTSYYQDLLLRRAGLLSVPAYLDETALRIRDLARVPGRRVDSVAQASLDAWTKLYRPHEGTRNLTVSYYLKGALVGLLLDLTIRAATAGERSLDDAMRSLWVLHVARPEDGFSHAELLEALAEAAGRSLEPEVAAWTETTEELPLAEALATHGLELVPRENREPGPWLGVTVDTNGGRTFVTEVLAGAPAEAAGIAAGDELLALDGWRLGKLADRLRDVPAGESAVLLVSRRGRVREVPIRPEPAPLDDLVPRPRPDATAAEAELFARWLGEPLAAAAAAPPPAPEDGRRPIL